MKVLYTGRKEHEQKISEILGRTQQQAASEEIRQQVWSILEAVRQGGDGVLLHYAERLDRSTLNKRTLRVPDEEIDQIIRTQARPEMVEALNHAANRIRLYHQQQKIEPFQLEDQNGMKIMQRVQPLMRAGIYVPGGKAKYPSSVLMAAIPAKVAGVREVIMVTPVPDNRGIDPHLLVAARIAGVDQVYRVGGAHAVAALAYGTETIPKVDKIVGPGNVYVDTAKRLLYGVVDIDMTAGPSEVLILADNTAKPQYLAADLIAQAEHDEDASCVLVLDSDQLVRQVIQEINLQLAELPRMRIAKKALADLGAIIICNDKTQAIDVANRYAPEHLQIYVADPQMVLERIHNAGAIFIGRFSPASLGDYAAGTNHILPTGGSARFFSPLSAYDFLKRSSVVMASMESLVAESPYISQMAISEDLAGHANTIRIRLPKPQKPEQ